MTAWETAVAPKELLNYVLCTQPYIKLLHPNLNFNLWYTIFMSVIQFKTKLFKINSWTILRLPENASAKLPSRGMAMVSGTINGALFKAVLEPYGKYAPGKKPSHWFRPDKKLLDNTNTTAGDTLQVALEPTKEWIEPEVPEDLK